MIYHDFSLKPVLNQRMKFSNFYKTSVETLLYIHIPADLNNDLFYLDIDQGYKTLH